MYNRYILSTVSGKLFKLSNLLLLVEAIVYNSVQYSVKVVSTESTQYRLLTSGHQLTMYVIKLSPQKHDCNLENLHRESRTSFTSK